MPDIKADWLQRVIGVSPGGQTEQTDFDSALRGWKAARAKVVDSLGALDRAISAFDDPEVPAALILLRAIPKQLTAEPTTREQVAELRRYLENDEVLTDAEWPNGFGIEVDICAPLLDALDLLGAAMATAS